MCLVFLTVCNPQFSLLWATVFSTSVAELMQHTFSTVASSEAQGKRRPCWHTIMIASEPLPRHVQVNHHLINISHGEGGVTKQNTFANSEETAAYPAQLARDISRCYVNALVQAGTQLPPQQLSALNNASKSSMLQTVTRVVEV